MNLAIKKRTFVHIWWCKWSEKRTFLCRARHHFFQMSNRPSEAAFVQRGSILDGLPHQFNLLVDLDRNRPQPTQIFIVIFTVLKFHGIYEKRSKVQRDILHEIDGIEGRMEAPRVSFDVWFQIHLSKINSELRNDSHSFESINQFFFF